tara:strand:- start:427 stop:1176 length:750 start_codon:yes stop_codon:yes gene_type:complete
MDRNIDGIIDGVADQVVAWRRHMHANPELSFEEYETSKFITSILEGLDGIEVSHPSGTSVVGRLRGKRPGPVIAIRADFDALPISEDTGLPFASKNEGVMHACGHDGHTSILLGAAKVLSGMRDDLQGEIRFLFQHGEETRPGGARGMIEGGAMDGVDRVIGLHLWSPIEIGTVVVNPTRVMAACDIFRIEVKGKGGHTIGKLGGWCVHSLLSAAVPNRAFERSLVSAECSRYPLRADVPGIFPYFGRR